MRSKVVKPLALALLLCVAGIGLAQQQGKKVRVQEEEETPRIKQKKARIEEEESPSVEKKTPPAKSKLEKMLAEALKKNPDIRVAVAKLAEAEAKLNRTRVQVTQKVVMLHQAILAQKSTVELAQNKFDRANKLRKSNHYVIGSEVFEELKTDLAVAKAKLEELEAQMPALLGKTARAEGDASSGLMKFTIGSDAGLTKGHTLTLKPTGPLAQRIRKALQTRVRVDYKDVAFADVLKDLEKKAPGLSIRDYARPNDTVFKVNLHFEEELPVSAVLQALTDFYQRLFLVRDYGLLATTQDYKPPPGAMTIEEFLRQNPTEK